MGSYLQLRWIKAIHYSERTIMSYGYAQCKRKPRIYSCSYGVDATSKIIEEANNVMSIHPKVTRQLPHITSAKTLMILVAEVSCQVFQTGQSIANFSKNSVT